jgi:nucleoid-associated protein YgaU
MAGEQRGVDEAGERLRASLEDLGARIDAARAGRDGAERRFRGSRGGWLVAALALVIALVVGLLAGIGDDGGENDVAAGNGPTSTVTSTSSPLTTAAGAPTTATTEAPTTTATTAAPTTATTAAPTTSTTAAPTTTTAPPTTATTAPPPTTEAPPPAATPEPPDRPTWTVQTGDSFWSIAERVVSERLGHTATNAEVTPYWVQLVHANGDRLVEPGNPNLIYPGQVMVLPAGVGGP